VLLTEPPSPTQVKVKLTAPLITIDCEPDVAFVPDQSPEALQLLASVDDQLKLIALPRLTLVGLALRLSVGSFAVGGVFTVMVTLSLALPPSPLQLML